MWSHVEAPGIALRRLGYANTGPSGRYRHAVETRGVGNLSPIHMEKLPAEIEPIADAVNSLIERLRRAGRVGLRRQYNLFSRRLSACMKMA